MWLVICYVAYIKNGDYGAPPGMLYMQYKQELDEKQEQIKKDYQTKFNLYEKTEGPSFGEYNTDESTHLLNNEYSETQTIINYEDTEEMPGSEDMD